MHGSVIGAAQCISMGRICHTAGNGASCCGVKNRNAFK